MSRNRLAQTKLPDFAMWLTEQGWSEVPVKGEYEVLRMKWNGDEDAVKTNAIKSTVLIVHTTAHATVHYTLHGESEAWFTRWLNDR